MNDEAETIALSYAELSRRLGVKLDSIRRHARRKRWRRVVGNDGTTRVLVPLDVLGRRTGDPADGPEDAPKGSPANPEDGPRGNPRGAGAAPKDGPRDGPKAGPEDRATAIGVLARQIERLEVEAERMRAKLDAAEAERDGLRTDLDTARLMAMEVEVLRATLAAMTDERDRWHAEATRPLLARLFGRRAA